jgi:Domain of unknown function (DUF4351)
MLQHARGRGDDEVCAAVERWRRILADVLAVHGQDRLLMLWSYLYHTTDVEPERMVDLLTRILPSMSKEKLMTTAERLRQKGSADMLLRLMARRFGPLRPELEEQIRAASIPELERWADAVLSARTLDEVMGAS